MNIAGRSFSVLAEVSVHSADVSGVLLKQGAGHGGYVLFVEDGRLAFVYNFFGESEQRVIAPDPVPLGDHILGVGYARTGTLEGTHTPIGVVTLRRRCRGGDPSRRQGAPFIFGLAGGESRWAATSVSRCLRPTPPVPVHRRDHCQSGGRRVGRPVRRPRA